jgi:hypothetical protein
MSNATNHDTVPAALAAHGDAEVYDVTGQPAAALPPGETPIALADVPHLPADVLPRRPGQTLHRSAPYRWASAGRRGVRLKTIAGVPGRYTCRARLREFLEGIAGNAAPAPAAVRSPARRRRQYEQAEKLLDAAGIG